MSWLGVTDSIYNDAQININAKILFKHIGIIILVKKCIWPSRQEREQSQMDATKQTNALFRKKIIIQ